jgi:hypothetical protein
LGKAELRVHFLSDQIGLVESLRSGSIGLPCSSLSFCEVALLARCDSRLDPTSVLRQNIELEQLRSLRSIS